MNYKNFMTKVKKLIFFFLVLSYFFELCFGFNNIKNISGKFENDCVKNVGGVIF